MNGAQQRLAAGIWMAALVGAVLAAPDHRWFHGIFAAVFTGVAIAFAWSRGMSRDRSWAAASLVSLIAGMAFYTVNLLSLPQCTAINASGERVVIGTEFTEKGLRYHSDHPSENNSSILEALGGLGPEQAWTAASIQRCRLRLAATGVLWIPLLGVSLICALSLITPAVKGQPVRTRKRVFISYNHEDAPVALRIRDLLANHNLEVNIDIDSMAAGQRIQEFIERCISDSDAVVSIVSNRSLLSSWVAMETINSLQRGKWVEGKLFIACYVDDDFFRPEFRLECTQKIDDRLQTVERLIPDYAAKKLDPLDLNEEKTRLFELRNNLGAVLAALKGSLCLDLRDSRFEESGQSLIAALTRTRPFA